MFRRLAGQTLFANIPFAGVDAGDCPKTRGSADVSSAQLDSLDELGGRDARAAM